MLPQVGRHRRRKRREPVVVPCLCRTEGCAGVSYTLKGPYTGFCDDCIVARGYWRSLAS